MATVTTITYAGPTTITLGLHATPLASSATFILGRESTQIDNTTNKYVDAYVSGFTTVGTTPTVNKRINIYFWGSHTDITATNLDTLDGTDSDETLTNTGVLFSLLRQAHTIPVIAATSNITYFMPPTSVVSVLGTMPQFWGLFVSHDTVAALNSTAGNHVFKYTGVTYTAT